MCKNECINSKFKREIAKGKLRGRIGASFSLLYSALLRSVLFIEVLVTCYISLCLAE